MLKRLYFASLLFLCSLPFHAQVISVNDAVSPEDLVTDYLINNSCAEVRNVQTHQWENGAPAPMGSFSANGSNFPFASGVVLTTGTAQGAIGPNESILSSGSTNWQGDTDLQAALNVSNTINACVLEFEFFPLGDQISFDYIFASEQYLSNPSANQCQYTDGFAFLLQAIGETGWENLAVVPGTQTPVAVNTVRGPGTICPESNPEYFDQFNTDIHPTNYNGQTVILKAQARVIPQQWYRIKLVVADQGNHLYDSAIFLGEGSFEITKDLGEDRLFATNNPVCPTENLVLNAEQIGAVAYQWFFNEVAIAGATAATYTPTQSGEYSVQIDLGSACLSTGAIQLDFAEFPPITADFTLQTCDADNDQQARFNLNALAEELVLAYELAQADFFLTEQEALAYENWITDRNTFAGAHNQTIYVRVANAWGCVQILPVNLQTAAATTITDPIWICLQEGENTLQPQSIFSSHLAAYLPSSTNFSFYLTPEDAELSQNWTTQFEFTSPVNLYVRGDQNGNCAGIWIFELHPAGFSNTDILPELIESCPATAVTLSAPLAAEYLWSTGATTRSIVVSEPGNYTVDLVHQQGCTASKTFTLTQTPPPVYLSHVVTDFSAHDNQLLINVENPETTEFSLDGITYQSAPVFNALAPGEYQFYLRDTAGCTTLGPFAFYILDYPRFFTPNADGINDYWNLPNHGNELLSYQIFNRYGQLLFSGDNQTAGWDGQLNGRPLPSTDYWVRIQKQDGRIILVHITLKR